MFLHSFRAFSLRTASLLARPLYPSLVFVSDDVHHFRVLHIGFTTYPHYILGIYNMDFPVSELLRPLCMCVCFVLVSVGSFACQRTLRRIGAASLSIQTLTQTTNNINSLSCPVCQCISSVLNMTHIARDNMLRHRLYFQFS